MADWEALKKAFEGCCSYCLVYVGDKATMDHVHPLSLGGRGTIDNVVPACRSCNSKKKNFLLIPFLKRIGCLDFFERYDLAMKRLEAHGHV